MVSLRFDLSVSKEIPNAFSNSSAVLYPSYSSNRSLVRPEKPIKSCLEDDSKLPLVIYPPNVVAFSPKFLILFAASAAF